MSLAIDLHEFYSEVECLYDGERYSVRDNGAVLRLPRNEQRPRPTDNKWTFGRPNSQNGYMYISQVRIHRIVATAFHGEPPTPEHVVDHIDTNRRNNRPENLRWLTRLENALLNPITVKRIEFICGTVEALKPFLKTLQVYVMVALNVTSNGCVQSLCRRQKPAKSGCIYGQRVISLPLEMAPWESGFSNL